MPHYEELFGLMTSAQDALMSYATDQSGAPGWYHPSLFESTGILSGGALSINSGDNTKFDMAAGVYGFANYTTNAAQPTRTVLVKAAVTAQTVTNIATALVTYIGVDVTGAIIQSITPFTNTQRRTIAQVGVLVHSNHVILNAINDAAAPVRAGISQLFDLMAAIGPMTISGNTVGANGANLSINKAAGTVFKLGCNFQSDPLNPHLITLASAVAPATMRYRLSDSTEYANTAVLDPLNYESAPGVRSNLSGANKFSVQRVALFTSNLIRIQYGQAEYNSMAEAEAAIPTQSFTTEANIAENGVLIAYVILRRSTTDLTNTSDAKFIGVGKFGNTSSSGQVLTSTDQLPEGSVNLYFTDARAQAAVVTASITNGDTTHSPSGDAVFDAMALKQPLDAELTAIAALTSAADRLPYFTGSGTAALATFTAGGRALVNSAGTADTFPYFSALNTVTLGSITAAGRALIDDAAASDQRTTLGLGTGDSPTFAGLTVTGLSTLAQAVNNGTLQQTKSAAGGVTPQWEMHGPSASSPAANSALGLYRWTADANGPTMILSKSRGTTVGSHSAVSAADLLGRLGFAGSDGAAFFEAARIQASAGATVGTGNVSGMLELMTTAAGGGAATTALTLNSDQSAAFAAHVNAPTTVVIGNTAAIPSNTRVLIDRIGTGTLPTLPGGTALTLQGNNASTNNNYLVNIAGATGQAGLRFGDSAAASQGRVDYDNATDSFGFYTNATLALTITSAQAANFAGAVSAASAALNTGTLRSFTSAGAAATPVLQVNGTSVATSSLAAGLWAAANTAPTVFLGYSANASVGSHTLVANNNILGVVSFNGSDGSVFREAARIEGYVNGPPGASDMPGGLRFLTTPDGSVTAAEVLTLDQAKLATFAGSISVGGGITGANIYNTYTPTLTGISNVSASSANVSGWIRIGNAVIVFTRLSVTATASATATEIDISIPVASNFAQAAQCVGVGGLVTGAVAETSAGGVQANITDDRATFRFTSTSTSARLYSVVFGYIVI